VEANPAWTESLGWERHELIGKSWRAFVHPDDIQKSIEAATVNHQDSFVNRYITTTGEYVELLWDRLTRDQNGNIYAIARVKKK
jgi:PAS domain S-box-containing protein